MRALGGEKLRGRKADAACGTGDDGNPAVESVRHCHFSVETGVTIVKVTRPTWLGSVSDAAYAACSADGLARHPMRVIRSQEDRDRCDVLGFTEAPERRARDQLLAEF